MKYRSILLISLLGAASSLHAATVSLASTMSGDSYISEDAATGGFGMIRLGNGSLGTAGANTGDADAIYDINNLGQANPGSPLGTTIDLFPRETSFQVGSLSYDETGLTGVGTETVAITSFDLSAFWTSDPARTNGAPGGPPTVISDISDHALGLWFFDAPGGISFGSLDASDTLTFTNGQLTSINLAIPTTFTVNIGTELAWSGTFSVTGNQIAYLINDVQETFIGPSTLTANLTGTVNAVVPEPAVTLLGSLGALLLLRRRRCR
ncbi:hypothetical protein OKA04_12550 [Luteolibacter flavescens]|uniref:PEP-CTERM sorting domain-containing protein n=1 Tax=Luteolibacter flavescens TaxID=1859460 RepID=A0ABT3FQP9_9BACT|nr:hypothetical protein [Luteolibacter flavescens]MCW1885561.1 hypothetical protein [Luteolibacter flavescens]